MRSDRFVIITKKIADGHFCVNHEFGGQMIRFVCTSSIPLLTECRVYDIFGVLIGTVHMKNMEKEQGEAYGRKRTPEKKKENTGLYHAFFDGTGSSGNPDIADPCRSGHSQADTGQSPGNHGGFR